MSSNQQVVNILWSAVPFSLHSIPFHTEKDSCTWHGYTLSLLSLPLSFPLWCSFSISGWAHMSPPLHLFYLSCCYPLPILCFSANEVWFALSPPCRNHRFLSWGRNVNLLFPISMRCDFYFWDGEAASYVFCEIMQEICSVSVMNIILWIIVVPNCHSLTHMVDWPSTYSPRFSPLCLWGWRTSWKKTCPKLMKLFYLALLRPN